MNHYKILWFGDLIFVSFGFYSNFENNFLFPKRSLFYCEILLSLLIVKFSTKTLTSGSLATDKTRCLSIIFCLPNDKQISPANYNISLVKYCRKEAIATHALNDILLQNLLFLIIFVIFPIGNNNTDFYLFEANDLSFYLISPWWTYLIWLDVIIIYFYLDDWEVIFVIFNAIIKYFKRSNLYLLFIKLIIIKIIFKQIKLQY